MYRVQIKVEVGDWDEREFQSRLFRHIDRMGIRIVAWLRRLTAELRPPARRGEPSRYAHPGHWADVTGALALGYQYGVGIGSHGGVDLVLLNVEEHAQYLEDRHGYWVLSGVGQPGSQADRIVRSEVEAMGGKVL